MQSTDMPVTKLILPVAGLGKRLRPLTLNCPKALVPVAGKPLLEYVLHEALATGIREVVLVISPQHERHFNEYLATAKRKFSSIQFTVRVQTEVLGDGHAVLQASDLIGDEAVAVRFCDDLLLDNEPVLGSLIALNAASGATVLLTERIPKEIISRYGVIGVGPVPSDLASSVKGGVHTVTSFVEKPSPDKAPSDVGVIGGYILAPNVVKRISELYEGLAAHEPDSLRIADALRSELAAGARVYAWEFSGLRLDCGTLEGFQTAEQHLKSNSNHFFARTLA